jgi:molybdopterin-guanine dinucleotide biosynthesis protein A
MTLAGSTIGGWVTVSAVVLAGGASRRMGADKAMLDVAGAPLLARSLAAARAVSDDVTIVGWRPAYARFGTPMAPDDFPGAGALGGLATALRVARYERTLVIACDMPLLSTALLRAMAAEPGDYDALVPRLSNGQRSRPQPQPLHAVYSRSCLPAIVQRIQAGKLSVVALLDDLRVRWLDDAWLRRFDPQLRSTHNANTPAQLAEARRLLELESEVSMGHSG